MPDTQPVALVPVVYVSAPVGILSGVSDQLVAAGAAPLVGWLSTGLFRPASGSTKAIVAKADAFFAPGIASGQEMQDELAGATEAGIPIFNDWTELQAFIADFAGGQTTMRKKPASKKKR